MTNAILAIPSNKQPDLSAIIADFAQLLRPHHVELQVVPFIAPKDPDEFVLGPVNETDRYFRRPTLKHFKLPRLVEKIREGITLFDLTRQTREETSGPRRVILRIIGSHLILVGDYLYEKTRWRDENEGDYHPFRRRPIEWEHSYILGLIPLADFLSYCDRNGNTGVSSGIRNFIPNDYRPTVTWPQVVAHLAWDPEDPAQRPNPVEEERAVR